MRPFLEEYRHILGIDRAISEEGRPSSDTSKAAEATINAFRNDLHRGAMPGPDKLSAKTHREAQEHYGKIRDALPVNSKKGMAAGRAAMGHLHLAHANDVGHGGDANKRLNMLALASHVAREAHTVHSDEHPQHTKEIHDHAAQILGSHPPPKDLSNHGILYGLLQPAIEHHQAESKKLSDRED